MTAVNNRQGNSSGQSPFQQALYRRLLADDFFQFLQQCIVVLFEYAYISREFVLYPTTNARGDLIPFLLVTVGQLLAFGVRQ